MTNDGEYVCVNPESNTLLEKQPICGFERVSEKLQQQIEKTKIGTEFAYRKAKFVRIDPTPFADKLFVESDYDEKVSQKGHDPWKWMVGDVEAEFGDSFDYHSSEFIPLGELGDGSGFHYLLDEFVMRFPRGFPRLHKGVLARTTVKKANNQSLQKILNILEEGGKYEKFRQAAIARIR